jgi:uncharacterized Ntn-hydrolase superfamily protein
MTFSIAARCKETGMFGVAVSSSSPAVAARCAYARAGVGAVASQNVTDPTLGPRMLDLMAGGLDAAAAMAKMKSEAAHLAYRQVLAVDRNGNSATHNGESALGLFTAVAGPDVACGGNMLADEGIPALMRDHFLASSGPLGERLLSVMEAGLAAGGEAGPVKSAGLYLVRDQSWPIADLRVDWKDDGPIAALRDLWTIYAPQMEDYVTRALNPEAAPSYGVPGDE